jgi:hypothetical protein
MPAVKYIDPETGYEWIAHFESQQEATDQAVADTISYGGVAAQEVADDQGATLVTQEEIIAAAEAEGTP